jgi:predicted HNH restriction endonuclease
MPFALHQNSDRMLKVDVSDKVWAFTRNPLGRYVLAAEFTVQSATTVPDEEVKHGRYRVVGDPALSLYFAVDDAPDAEPLFRALFGITAEKLGHAFQGGAGVQVLTADQASTIAEFAKGHPVRSPPGADLGRDGDRHANKPWMRDELILALDLYLAHRRSPPGPRDPKVIELSSVLNALWKGDTETRTTTFRNPNGVGMKLMNFRRFDPEFTATGRTGLRRGNRLELEVWNEFAEDPTRLRRVAEAIRNFAGSSEAPPLSSDAESDDFEEAAEGCVLSAVHHRRERNAELVKKKKARALREHGKLICEGCGFSFEDRYGERGRTFIECHHTKPVHTLEVGSKTHINDLRLVCANCHRMIHARRPWLSLAELRLTLVDTTK